MGKKRRFAVFVTPKGEPFFDGTYFPPEERYGRPGFAQIVLGLSEAWKERRPELRTQVEQFLKGYRILEKRLFGGGHRRVETCLPRMFRSFRVGTQSATSPLPTCAETVAATRR